MHNRTGRLRLAAMALIIVTLPLVLFGLQRKFDEADHKKALTLLGSKRPGASWSVGEELYARGDGREPDCRPKLLSSLRGTLEVTCFVGRDQTYRFAVDLVRQSMEPVDEPTKALVASALAKAAVGPDGGASTLSAPSPDG